MEYASTFDQLKFEYLIITAILIHNLFTNFVLSSFHFVNFVNLKKFFRRKLPVQKKQCNNGRKNPKQQFY